MLGYIIRRLLLMIPTLLGITILVFLVMALAPGGIGASLMSDEGSMRAQDREALRRYYNERYGLDKPLHMQYLRWLHRVSPIGTGAPEEGWMGYFNVRGFGLKKPDLGRSLLADRPVLEMIGEALPVTLLLNFITIPLVYGIAITSGVYAARYRGKAFDVGTGFLFIALWSLPSMLVGVLLLGFFANRDYFHWFPTGGLHHPMAETFNFLPTWGEGGFERGWLLDTAWHLVLPVVCLTYGSFAFLSKLMRASMLENLAADFVRTARAKGARERVLLFRHVLRNSMLPLITVAASILPGLLGGSIIIEQIFSLPGMGRLMIEAISKRDNELVLSETLIIAVVSLVSLLLADLAYAVADPRVSYE